MPETLPSHVTNVGDVVEPLSLDERAAMLVADWPPFSETQRDQLAVLLRPAADGAA